LLARFAFFAFHESLLGEFYDVGLSGLERLCRLTRANPRFIGFAVGRTVFWAPLVGWRDKKTTREEAVTEIARRYRKFVEIFEKAPGS
jgi:myo-inositol catabolism protein IolC